MSVNKLNSLHVYSPFNLQGQLWFEDEKNGKERRLMPFQKGWPKWCAIVTYAMEGDPEREKWFDNTLLILVVIQPYVMWNLLM
jgi:hypothetical protein